MNLYRNPNLQIMANVHQYIIIYFTLIIHESMSNSIYGNLCLETVVRFTYHQAICDFDSSTAKSALKDVNTCPNKCNYWMNDLNDHRNSLRRIDLTIGNAIKGFNFCPRSSASKYLKIYCSSWNATEYVIWDDVYACSINDAQCVRITNYCICHCMPGYILVDDKCLKKTVPAGGFCSLSVQCRGSDNSGICEDGRCTCAEGFTFIDFACKKKLDDWCDFTEQCIQPFSVCIQGKCKCMNGYSAFQTESCHKDNVPVGGLCSIHEQCTGSHNSGICEHGRCTCAEGFIFFDLACMKRNLELNDSCEITEQCKQPLSVCFQGKCKCIKGYSAFDIDSCIKDHQNSSGSSNCQQYDTHIGGTLGALFGGLILGVIVTAIVTTLVYRRLTFRTRNSEEPDVMSAENRACGASKISYTNNKKQKVAKSSPNSFSEETPAYNTLQPTSLSLEEGHYSTLGQ
nr:uncharacterized protein LOC117682682 isoform X2 [Crassostrea gigas]